MVRSQPYARKCWEVVSALDAVSWAADWDLRLGVRVSVLCWHTADDHPSAWSHRYAHCLGIS